MHRHQSNSTDDYTVSVEQSSLSLSLTLKGKKAPQKILFIKNLRFIHKQRSVLWDLCSSILRNACWDNAGLANFISSNDVKTSNLKRSWQLVVAGQYRHPSRSFVVAKWATHNRQAQVVRA